MDNGLRLLPTTVNLSADSALGFVLTDIPLFCQGVMAIGIFTFYFLTKQVKLASFFLYGASFLAFVAATLDLGQVVFRGRFSTVRTLGLGTIAGFITAREIFLALSYTALNLFIWLLVAECPLNEKKLQNPLTGDENTAAWSRWGIVGYILRWGSLVAALSVGILQIIWRLVPQQRTLSSIYVAAATLQSSLTTVFLLKLILNVYASPIRPWYLPFRSNIVPMSSLVVGVSISVGNLMIFAFSETSLGRFLYAVQVYILMVHNLYSSYHLALAAKEDHDPRSEPVSQEKPAFKVSSPTLPVFEIPTYARPRATTFITIPPVPQQRPPSVVWTPPARAPVTASKDSSPRYNPQDVYRFPPVPEIRRTSPTTMGNQSDSDSANSPRPLRVRNMSAQSDTPSDPEPSQRTTTSLSYYSKSRENSTDSRQPPFEPPNPGLPLPPMTNDSRDKPPNLAPPRHPGEGSKQSSITSLDVFIQEQVEIDKDIAALGRLYPSSLPNGPSQPTPASRVAEDRATVDRSRSVNESYLSKTESPSGQSEFSLLDVFPEPPKPRLVDSVTKYTSGITTTDTEVNDKEKDQLVDSPANGRPYQSPPQTGLNTAATRMFISLSAVETENPDTGRDFPFASAGTQYDVTSFIGGLSSPSRGGLDSGRVLDDAASDITSLTTNETATIATAVTLRPNPVLRSMILSTVPSSVNSIVGTPEPRNSTSPRPVGYYADGSNRGPPRKRSASESTPGLRPLLIGTPASELPQRIPASSSMVPLAQRRKRGGSLTGQGRPVISAPIQRLSDSADKPGAFERPRPPPLRLIPE